MCCDDQSILENMHDGTHCVGPGLGDVFDSLHSLHNTRWAGRPIHVESSPGLGLLLLITLLVLAGFIADHVIGQGLFERLEQRIEQIPLVQSIYLTLKGMTDVLNFRSRFGRSKVVAFPFPRDGCWALGFVMGIAPPSVQVEPSDTLFMVFVPTAIHPFTGFLAFIPEHALRPINLPVEDAMKMEFSAGFYKPKTGWLGTSPSLPS